MKSLLFFFAFFLLGQNLLSVSGSSRDARSFTFSVDQSRYNQEVSIRFDPFLQNFGDSLREICSSILSCKFESDENFQSAVSLLNAEYAQNINDRMIEMYHRSPYSTSQDGRIKQVSQNEWLGQADDSTVWESEGIDTMTARLRDGLQHISLLDPPMTHELRAMAHKWGIQDCLHEGSTPLDLIDSAIRLFNNDQYQQSFVVASHLLLQQRECQGQTHLHSAKSEVYNLDTQTKLSLFSLLSELFQLDDNVTGSTIFRAKTLILLSNQLIYATDEAGQAEGSPAKGTDSVDAFIARIRVIAYMPILPSVTSAAAAHRADIIEDIESLTLSFVASGATVPIQLLMNKLSSTFFRLPHQGLNDKEINVAVTRMYAALCPDFSYTSPRLLRPPAASTVFNAAEQDGLVVEKKNSDVGFRVAFVSSHFYHHSIGRMLIEVMHFMQSDATKGGSDSIELFAFFMTGLAPEDELTDAFVELLGVNFVRVPITDIRRMREVIGSEQHHLDAIVLADVGMEMQSVVLANSRLAPIQIAWWGHPVTTAAPAVDFFFGLDIEAPQAGPQHYSEQLVRLQWMNTAPIRPLSQSDRALMAKLSRRDLGLPDHSKHFMILGRLFKIHPVFDDVLFNILARTPPEVYVLVVRESSNTALNAELYLRWKAKQERVCCDISSTESAARSCCGNTDLYREYHREKQVNNSGGHFPSEEDNNFLDSSYVLHRLRFVHYKHYTHALTSAVGVLDTFPYGGCLTSHDALSNAIPMVTLPLEHVRGRYSLGLYRQMGHTALVARNQSVYADLAVRLALDDVFRQAQSLAIAERYSSMHKNNLVAVEWLQFLNKAIKQQL